MILDMNASQGPTLANVLEYADPSGIFFLASRHKMSGDEQVIPPPYLNTGYNNPQWVLFVDPEDRRPYFFNTDTGETSWEDPEPPAGAEIYAIEKGREESVSPLGCDKSEERNFFLMTMVEKEIDRGVPPYLSNDWRTCPARRQSDRDMSKIAYKEGSDRYNIWYHRHSVDRFEEAVRVAATSRCDPWTDSGWTEADSKRAESAPICMWFAKGCCSQGEKCRYKHRVPTRQDDEENDNMIDIFGRARHAQHSNDMGGVGSFLKECRSLYISEIALEEGEEFAVQKLEAQLWKLFHPWGPIESIRVIPNRLIAFVKYEYRSAAEFAKVACTGQPCGTAEAINVRWAFEDPNPRATEQAEIDTQDQFLALVEKRIAAMSLQERIERGLIKEVPLEERFETSIADDG